MVADGFSLCEMFFKVRDWEEGKILFSPKVGVFWIRCYQTDEMSVQATRKFFLRAEAWAISRPTPYLLENWPSCGAHQRTMPTQ